MSDSGTIVVGAGTDSDLGAMSTDTLIRLFSILPDTFCAQIWQAMSDVNGQHARALLRRRRKKYPLRPDLAPFLWPRLKGFLEHLLSSSWGKKELAEMEIDDCFLNDSWPYIAASMGTELCLRDARLVPYCEREKTKFSTLYITPIALSCIERLVHPQLTSLILHHQHSIDKPALYSLLKSCGLYVTIIHVDQGILPELFEVLQECLPPSRSTTLTYESPNITFAQMQWVVSWWRETKEKRLVISTNVHQRWLQSLPQQKQTVYTTTSSPSSISSSPPPPERAEKIIFSYDDVEWLTKEVQRRKRQRRDQSTKCPGCGTYDPVARHLLVGRGYICEFSKKVHSEIKRPRPASNILPKESERSMSVKRKHGPDNNEHKAEGAPVTKKTKTRNTKSQRKESKAASPQVGKSKASKRN